jgi:hypothetical protein
LVGNDTVVPPKVAPSTPLPALAATKETALPPSSVRTPVAVADSRRASA